MKNSYRTIREDGQSEQEIKKSRFICSLKRVTSEEEAKAFILALKKSIGRPIIIAVLLLLAKTMRSNEAATMGNQAVPLVSPC